jgi:SAM-dependent methyltransferase
MAEPGVPVGSDHFSACADAYATYRPTYPRALVEHLGTLAPRREVVWEAGCGSGQLTTLLAEVFARVIATDTSAEQLSHAPALPNVEYRRASAESSGLPARVADLVVAAQAAHWFDLPAFYDEARRVGRVAAVIALVSYGVVRAGADVDPVIHEFHGRTLAPFWPPERRHVDTGYRTLDFPFEELPSPVLEMTQRWTLEEFIGYMRTWSAVRALLRAGAEARLQAVEAQLHRIWSDGARREIRWSLVVRAGRL